MFYIIISGDSSYMKRRSELANAGKNCSIFN
jgi:hypothetical protein